MRGVLLMDKVIIVQIIAQHILDGDLPSTSACIGTLSHEILSMLLLFRKSSKGL